MRLEPFFSFSAFPVRGASAEVALWLGDAVHITTMQRGLTGQAYGARRLQILEALVVLPPIRAPRPVAGPVTPKVRAQRGSQMGAARHRGEPAVLPRD